MIRLPGYPRQASNEHSSGYRLISLARELMLIATIRSSCATRLRCGWILEPKAGQAFLQLDLQLAVCKMGDQSRNRRTIYPLSVLSDPGHQSRRPTG
jgi:hypothetical protein